ncbi:Fic family protein [Ornithinimicrobium cryptoxanthini]|uniref:Fic family protein n=1 Tax=Ornithinimicrobium cryptoxanthini TaxID=2934161 RepID=UPI002118E375|nr:Fic/DOC family N-terminal domain-containing protein [Ornithinimicrobium cryptoxanthini]
MGELVPVSGYDATLRTNYRHKAFVPFPLPSEVSLSQATHKLLGLAERGLGRLDAAAARLPNPNLLVSPAIYREAVSTSAIEGTFAPLVDVLEAEVAPSLGRSHEVLEILNYIRAAQKGLTLIERKPLCLSVVAELQAVLVAGTRGDMSDSGGLRTSQVYIGERHRGIEHSRFLPPPPGESLQRGMTEWEKWVNAEDDVPTVAKVALTHYQFETLHPFSDGNGRLGRLLVVLQLVAEGVLRHPILSLSPWLEPRKDEYKDHLLSVSATGEFEPWVAFFARAVIAQAGDTESRMDAIEEIRVRTLGQLRTARAKGVVIDLVDTIIANPVITVPRAADAHGVTFPPANNAIDKLVSMGFLEEITGRAYGRVFFCREVMDVLQSPSS